MAEITHTDRLSRLLARQRREAQQRRDFLLIMAGLLTLALAICAVVAAGSHGPLQPAQVVGLAMLAVVFLLTGFRAALAEEAVLAIDRTIEAHDAEMAVGRSTGPELHFAVAADVSQAIGQIERSLEPRRPPYRHGGPTPRPRP